MEIIFEIGATYRNRRGEYVVQEITAGGKLKVRYLQDGSQAELDQAQQARIINNMLAEQTAEAQRTALARPAPKTKNPETSKPATPAGPKPETPAPKAQATVRQSGSPVQPPPPPAKSRPASAPVPLSPPTHLEPLAEVRTQFGRHEVLRLVKFIGYGRPDGLVWFIGPDETGAEDGNVTLSERTALAEFQGEYVDAGLHKNRLSDLQAAARHFPSWPNLNYLVTSLVLPPEQQTPEGRRLYFKDRFGAADGDALLADILSLPALSPVAAQWPYRQTLITDSPRYNTVLRDPLQFQEDPLLGREIRLRRLSELYASLKANKRAPAFVVCHGQRSSWKYFRDIFPNVSGYTVVELKFNSQRDRAGRVELARDDNGALIVLTPYLSGNEGVTTYFLDQLGAILQVQRRTPSGGES